MVILDLLAGAAWYAAKRKLEQAVWRGVATLATRTGRTVTAESVAVHLGRQVRIEVRGLRIEAAAGAVDREPALRVEALRAAIPLQRLWHSRGQSVEIDSIAIEGARARVARGADGAFSLDDVVTRLRVRAPEAARPAERSVHVGRVDVRDGSITFVETRDGAVARTASLTHLAIVVRDWRPRAPFQVVLDARLGDALAGVHVRVDLVPQPRPDARDAMRVTSVTATLEPTRIDPLLALALLQGAPIARGILRGAIRVSLPHPDGVFGLDVDLHLDEVSARDARLANGSAAATSTAALSLHGSIDPRAGDVDIRHVLMTLDGMQVAGNVALHGAGSRPEIRALDIRATRLLLERMVPFLPAGLVPARARFDGPVDFEATAAGSPDNAQLDARLDFTSAAITLPDLRKPAGSPFSVEFHGHAAGQHLEIARMGVVLGPLHMLLRGTVEGTDTADLTFDTGNVALEGLLPFLPSVRHDLAGRASLHGTARVEGRVRRARREDVLHLGLTLRGAQVITETLRLEGDIDARADARLERGRQSLVLDLDATRAAVTAGTSLDKPAGVALRVHADLQRVMRRAIAVRAFTVDTQGLWLEASGTYDPAHHHYDARCVACDINAARFAGIVPALPGRLPVYLSQAVLHATFTADGDPASPADSSVRAGALRFDAPYVSLRGRLEIEGLRRPRRVSFDLDVDRLDLDAIERTGTVRPAAIPSAPSVAMLSPTTSASREALLNTLEIDGGIRAREIATRDTTITGLVARVTARDGNLDFPTLRFRYADGNVDLSHSRWQLTGRHRLDVHARATGLDLALLGSGEDTAHRATGRLDIDTDFTGSTEDADVARTFLGSVHLTGRNMVVQRVVTPVMTIDHPLLTRFSLRLGPREGSNEPRPPVGISHFDARLRLDGGVLRTIAPVVADTDLGRLEVDGSASIDGALDLRGTVLIAPEEIWRQSNHRLLPPAPVPIRVHITGQTDEPRVVVVDLGATIRSLVGSGFRALGQRLSERFAPHPNNGVHP